MKRRPDDATHETLTKKLQEKIQKRLLEDYFIVGVPQVASGTWKTINCPGTPFQVKSEQALWGLADEAGALLLEELKKGHSPGSVLRCLGEGVRAKLSTDIWKKGWLLDVFIEVSTT